MLLEFNQFKERAIKNLIDQAATIEMEVMLNRVSNSGVEQRIDQVQKALANTDESIKEKMQKYLKDAPGGGNPALDEMRKKQLDEMLDGKIHNAFEGLRSDNLFIWKQSLELAEKEFTEKGVGQTMNMLPKTILDRNDLKRTVNSLILEENTLPKPQVVTSTLPPAP